MTVTDRAAVARTAPAFGLVVAALAVVYVVWGSTYLAIRVVVETIPPFLSAGIRFSFAGAAMLAFLAWRRGPAVLRPGRRQLLACLAVGTLLMGANAVVSVAEVDVPSSMAALLIASVPLWVILMRRGSGERVSRAGIGAVLVGFAGVALLLRPGEQSGDATVLGLAAVVYVVWGSTYLAIRIVVEEAPPLTSMGIRYVVAGALLAAILATRGGVRRLALSRKEALGAAFLGLMLPLMGNGMVSVGEDMGAPSGVTALLIAVTPLMIVLFRSAEGDRPSRRTLVGVFLGFTGLAYLILAGHSGGSHDLRLGAALVIMLAATCWAIGSYVQPRLWLPADVFVIAVYEMLFGGLMLLTVGRVAGESFTADYSPRIWLALAYLIVFGSWLAFTAYAWLLQNAPISKVSTYAYVNPVVAIVLGFLILDEVVTPVTVVGAAIIVVAVALVVRIENARRP